MNHEEHEDHEGRHEGGLRPLRIRSSLPPQVDLVVTRTIGCAIAVHRALGPGFLELIYRKAMCVELAAQRLSFVSERSINVMYRGVAITGQRLDLLVESCLIVELKCVERFDDIHRLQVISYLRTTGLRAALLVNFKVPVLRRGLMRIVL